MRTMRILPAILLAVPLLHGTGAEGGDKLRIAARWSEGEVARSLAESSMELSGTVLQEGQPAELKVHKEERREWSDEILALAEGRPSRWKRTWSICETRHEMTQNGESPGPTTETGALKGRTLTLVRDASGVKVEEPGVSSAELEAGDLAPPDRWATMLPESEVEAGATWTLDTERVLRMMPALKSKDARMTCVFRGMKPHGGAQAARIDLELTATIQDAALPGPTTVESKGQAFWDVANGRLLEITLEGTMTIDAGPGGKLSGPTKLSLKVETR